MSRDCEMTPMQHLYKILDWLKDQAEKGDPEAIQNIQQIPEVLAKLKANPEAGRTPVLRVSS